MTWLTPLFLAAGLAVAGPILFHLWQRAPRGRRLFSSTMFLHASPPRVTRRSRIEQWLLLSLRALALLLLAVGFARPVWRTALQTPTISSPEKSVAILVDVSASLQRSGFWEDLIRRAMSRLDNAPASTQFGLFAFDHDWKAVVPFASDVDGATRRQRIRESLATLKPGWGGTQLGDGLARTVQALRDWESSRPVREAAEIWLVSDLASGAGLAGLAGVDWPESLTLEVITPDVPLGANAGLQWVESRSHGTGGELRVRVTNARHSTRDRFQIGWESDSARIDVHVPAGQSRTVLAPPRPAAAGPLRLFGDDHEFDNRLWTAERRRRDVWILYLGRDADDDPKESRFFLEQALVGTSEAAVTIRTAEEANDADPPALAVWTDADVELPAWLQSVVERGGSLLVVPRTADEARHMLAGLGMVSTDVREADVPQYSLLTDVDFEDPLFAAFAQARFADFTGIHFWKHRRVAVPGSFRVLARFDNGDPWLMERPIGAGRCWLLTSGWRPVDSQLARSSKFAPLLHRLLEQATPLSGHAARGEVGAELTPIVLRDDAPRAVRRPDGSTDEWPSSSPTYPRTDLPGFYVAEQAGTAETWAINVSPDESRTDPLAVETLERFGVVMQRPAAAPATIVSPIEQRQMQLAELERHQKLWRWCLLAAAAVLLIETAYATVRSRGLAFEPQRTSLQARLKPPLK